MSVVELWRCGECGTVHKYEDEAYECCAPHVQECFQCSECGTVHDDDAIAAVCCGFDAESGTPLTPAAYMHVQHQLEAAGQLRLVP